MNFLTWYFPLIFFTFVSLKLSCSFIQSLRKKSKSLWPFQFPPVLEKNSLYLIFQLEGRVADSFQWGGNFLPIFRTHPFPKFHPLRPEASVHCPHLFLFLLRPCPGNGTVLRHGWGTLAASGRPGSGLSFIPCLLGSSFKSTVSSDFPASEV